MMKTPELHEIDESIYDGTKPPTDFVDSCFDFKQLMDVLEIEDDPTFWRLYRDGQILPGVALPTSTPFLCWDRDIVRMWLELGKPCDPSFAAHRALVLSRLVDSVRNSLSANPPTNLEKN